MCTSNRDDRQAWECGQAKPIKTLGRTSQGVNWSWSQCIKSHHAQTSSGKGLPSHFWTRNIVLFSDESKCSGPRVWRKSGETQNPCCLKSRVKFPHSVMIWAAMSSAGVGPLCFLKSTVNADIYQEMLEHFSFLLLTSFMEMLISFSSRTWHLSTLPKVTKAVSMNMVLLCLIGQQTRLTWTPSRIYSRGRWETPHPTMLMTWRPLSKQPGFHYTWAVPQTDCLHATLHWCSNSCKRRPNQVLSA